MEKKQNKLLKKLYVYNLALRREDGKIEQDTVYREQLLSSADVDKLGIEFSCSVLASCIGVLRLSDDDFVKANTFTYQLPKPQEVDYESKN